MSSPGDAGSGADAWGSWAESMNERFAEAAEANAEAQLRFTEAWLDAVEEASEDESMAEGTASLYRAYEVWMSAAHDTFELVNDSVEGEDVPVEAFRDTWLNAANQAFKEVMSTTTFSMATGRSIDDLLEFREELSEVTESTLHEAGLATRGDVQEVGERLLELERRYDDLSGKIDDVLEAVDAGE